VVGVPDLPLLGLLPGRRVDLENLYVRVRESTAAGGCPGQPQLATDPDGADDRGGPELRADEVQPVVVVRAQRREVGARVTYSEFVPTARSGSIARFPRLSPADVRSQ